MRKFVVFAVLLFACSFASQALADGYVGASFVQTDSEFDLAIENFEADDSSYKIFAGYNFIKWFGLEASWRDLGSHDDTVGMNTIDVDIEAFDISARGILPLGKRFSVFAKAGYANISTDGSVDLGGLIQNFDEDDWELMYGVGVGVRLFDHFGLRAEWEEYDVDDDLNSLSVGAFFRF